VKSWNYSLDARSGGSGERRRGVDGGEKERIPLSAKTWRAQRLRRSRSGLAFRRLQNGNARKKGRRSALLIIKSGCEEVQLLPGGGAFLKSLPGWQSFGKIPSRSGGRVTLKTHPMTGLLQVSENSSLKHTGRRLAGRHWGSAIVLAREGLAWAWQRRSARGEIRDQESLVRPAWRKEQRTGRKYVNIDHLDVEAGKEGQHSRTWARSLGRVYGT